MRFHALFIAAGLAAACFTASGLSGQTASGTVSVVFSPSSGSNQMAVWLESPQGLYAGTLFLTDFIGRRGGGNRTADPKMDTGSGNRPDALPVWAHRRNRIDTTWGAPNLYPPPESAAAYPGDIDAVSAATPGEGMQSADSHAGNLPSGTWAIWAEVSRSFQTNAYHNYSFYRGQPSVLWKAELRLSGAPDSAGIADYIGYGSPDGSDGDVRPPDSTITTAADRLSLMPDGFRFKAVFTPDWTGVDGEADPDGGPASFDLRPNFPNPFNSSTVVSFSVPSDGPAALAVYDAAGRNVRTLEEGYRKAGTWTAVWDGLDRLGSEAGSGIYLVRLETPDGAAVRKILLIR
jgi:hypothetical protein